MLSLQPKPRRVVQPFSRNDPLGLLPRGFFFEPTCPHRERMRTAEVVVARRILHQFRVLRNADPHAYQACVDRVLAGLREDSRAPQPARVLCEHGFDRGHWLIGLAFCNGPDVITQYLAAQR